MLLFCVVLFSHRMLFFCVFLFQRSIFKWKTVTSFDHYHRNTVFPVFWFPKIVFLWGPSGRNIQRNSDKLSVKYYQCDSSQFISIKVKTFFLFDGSWTRFSYSQFHNLWPEQHSTMKSSAVTVYYILPPRKQSTH